VSSDVMGPTYQAPLFSTGANRGLEDFGAYTMRSLKWPTVLLLCGSGEPTACTFCQMTERCSGPTVQPQAAPALLPFAKSARSLSAGSTEICIDSV
jgi:hypothetical protein